MCSVIAFNTLEYAIYRSVYKHIYSAAVGATDEAKQSH